MWMWQELQFLIRVLLLPCFEKKDFALCGGGERLDFLIFRILVLHATLNAAAAAGD